MACETAQYLTAWQHTILVCGGAVPDADMTVHAQGCGLDVLIADNLDSQEAIEDLGITGAVLYDMRAPAVEDMVPALYYGYGRWKPGKAPAAFCSTYAAAYNRDGSPTDCNRGCPVIPPLIHTRALRRLAGPGGPYTVGLLNSGRYDKFPCSLAMHMLSALDPDMHLIMTSLNQYKHPGMKAAIDEARSKAGKGGAYLSLCPVHPSGGLQYTVRADVMVYGTASNYHAPYSRLVVESMAMGKPVIVERRGVFAELLEHGKTALLFDSPEEAVDHVRRLRQDKKLAEKLGANAQLWASWQDITVNIGTWKEMLRR